MAKKRVAKALSPEEQTVLGNISSLVDQLMAGGGEEEVMMGEEEFEDPEDDPGMVAKANEGPTANPETKAEDRVEDPTDITAANLSEVGKSLGQLVNLLQNRTQPVRKSTRRPVQKSSMDTLVMKSLAEISTAMKSIADKQSQNDLAISNILEGMGVVEQIQKAAPGQPVHKSAAPVQNVDGNAVLAQLTEVLKGMQGQQVAQHSDNPWVTKSSQHNQLASALPMIFNQ